MALAARDEAELLKLEDRLRAAGIPHSAIREPDDPYFNALMAIGIPPMERVNLRKFLSGFPLAR